MIMCKSILRNAFIKSCLFDLCKNTKKVTLDLISYILIQYFAYISKTTVLTKDFTIFSFANKVRTNKIRVVNMSISRRQLSKRICNIKLTTDLEVYGHMFPMFDYVVVRVKTNACDEFWPVMKVHFLTTWTLEIMDT